MKNIAIATIWKRYLITNYGSFFQHYALRRFLRGRGYDSFRIWDFNEHFGVLGVLRTSVKGLLMLPKTCIKERISVLLAMREVFAVARCKLLFLQDYSRLVGPERECQKWSEETVFVAGGDQVWTGFEATCWGVKVPPSVKKISYAASADWSSRKKDFNWRSHAKMALEDFRMISVREEMGRRILSDIFEGRKTVEHVADPVFLLDKEEYLRLTPSRKIFSRPTLLCYLVNLYSEKDCSIAVIRKIAELLQCDLKIIAVQGAGRYLPKENCLMVSPTEFLACFRDADYVLTNSYHGLLFGVVFEKHFVGVLQHSLPSSNQNQRQEEFMRLCGLSNRWRALDNAEAITSLLREDVPFEIVRRYVDVLVSESKDKLDLALADMEDRCIMQEGALYEMNCKGGRF